VTNSDSILRHITVDGATDATVSAALDALREDRECGLLQAVCLVAAHWRAAFDAREIAEASRLIERGAPHRWMIQNAVRVLSGIPLADPHTLVVVSGTDGPRAHLADGDTGVIEWGRWLITVGARWLIDYSAATFPAGAAARRRANRSRGIH
jgi:hypothetical protein